MVEMRKETDSLGVVEVARDEYLRCIADLVDRPGPGWPVPD